MNPYDESRPINYPRDQFWIVIIEQRAGEPRPYGRRIIP